MSDSIDPATRMGPVRLTVAELDVARSFYRRALGLDEIAAADGAVCLGAPGGAPLVELEWRPDAPPRPRPSTGLFHLAILVPSRADLGRALRRALDAGASFTGASDHLVSEALYLDDPEGNGIEIYRDRPREEWGRDARGDLRMATLPLDVGGVAAAAPAGPDEGMPEGTAMGHVHLQVRDIPEAEAFWSGTVGFEPTVRGYPGALFVSAGGYHHHLGLNTWGTAAAAPPPDGARGLRRFEVVVSGPGELARVEARARAAGVEGERTGDGLLLRDPSGNAVLFRH